MINLFKSKKVEVKSSNSMVKLSAKELSNVVGGIDGDPIAPTVDPSVAISTTRSNIKHQ